MTSPLGPPRTGIFISHANEDEDLAECLRELLQAALGIEDVAITCTSDEAYGLERGADLEDQIRHRLRTAKALFCLATPNAIASDWVRYECAYADQASADGEMSFYLLAPTASDISSIPEPFRDRLTVTLSEARDLHAFVGQLRDTFRVARPGAAESRVFEAVLRLHSRGAALERERLKDQHEEEIQALRGRQAGQVKALQDTTARLWRERIGATLAAGVLLTALGVSVYMHSGEVASYARTIAAHDGVVAELKARHAAAMEKQLLEIDQKVTEEFRSFPFVGIFRNARNQIVPCVSVTAYVPQDNGENKPIGKNCTDGRFTFNAKELGVDPRETFTLIARVRNPRASDGSEQLDRDVLVHRPTLPVWLLIDGAQ